MIDFKQERCTDTVLLFRATATVELQVDQLQPNPRHHRRGCSETDLAALTDSLRQHGLLHSLCVRPLEADHYEIIAGERRWRAAQLAGITSLSCHIFEVDEGQAFVLALVENIHRCEITPLEEAQAYQEMLDRGIVRNRAEIARKVGFTRPRITQRMKLLELDPVTQRKLAEHPNLLTESHGRFLLEVADLAERHQLAEAVVALKWSRDRLREEIEERCRSREMALWQSGSRAFPTSYVLNHTGISLRINLLHADLEQQLEVMRGVTRKLQALVESRASLPVEDGAQEVGSGKSVKPFNTLSGR